ncbi:MAG: DUF5106 domain-containing protein [Flavipsychrobacter sp.]|nr:DUF5106 domain-containing protein [Flavipsychrobacter sp.]
MKRITLFALLLSCMAQLSFARDGYHIQIKFTDTQDTMLYLAHYYGKPLPTIYKADSAHISKNGTVTLDSKEPLVGGIYLILLSDKKTYFEFLLNNGDDMSISADASKLPDGLKFKGSTENENFQSYVTFLKGYGEEQEKLKKEYQNAKTPADTANVRKKGTEEAEKLTKYRKSYIASHPNTLLASIFSALDVPQVPEGKHYLEDGTLDSNFAYKYYKAHYWDGFNLQDDRLIHTPIFDGKLDEYMNKLVYPYPTDSVEKECDYLLHKTKGTKELFKYTLWWLTRNVENSKIMGMDEVFVYLVENYYMKGEATWLTNDELQKYIDRAMKIAPNVIGNVGPDVKLPSVITKKEESLMDVKAKYTLLIFWSPDCGHCIMEMPQIDSLYRASLKAKGVKIYSVATEGDEKKIKEFYDKHDLKDWIITWDPDHTSDYRSKYDVYSTPTIYLLDEKKIIRGKRLDHSNIGQVLEFVERKEKMSKKAK